MSVTVTIAGGTAVNVSVSGNTGVSVLASGGIGPAGFLTPAGTNATAFGTLALAAGPGVTISTTSGQFLISSYDTAAVANFAPVQSVAGRTGAITLSASDVTAGTFAITRIPTISYTALSSVPTTFTPAAHTHDASAISAGTLAHARLPTISYTALSNVPASFTPSSHTHDASEVASGVLAIGRIPAIGYTALSGVPLTFAPATHTHAASEVTSGTFDAARIPAIGYTALSGVPTAFTPASHTHDAAAVASGVLAIGRIPTIGYTALSGVPLTFAPATHTHSTADVVGLTANFSQLGHTHDAAAVASGVLAIGRIPAIGYTALSGVPLTFAPSTHTHSTSDITGYQGLPAQAGYAGPLVTDGTNATWTSRYGVVSPVLVQGNGMVLTRDTAAGLITVAFAGGTSGVVVGSATPQPLGVAATGSSANASREDHVHALPTLVQSVNNLTGTLTIASGANVTVSTAGSTITIAAGGGGGGGEDALLRGIFAPPAPTGLTATLGNAQVTLSWTAPTGVIAQAPITDYREQYSTDGGATWTTFSAAASTATSATVTGLTNGTAYVFRVAAVNAVGVGAYTAASSSVTPLAFSPTSIAGLQLWLDASDALTLFDATSGGSLVAADGGVARWEDKSGNARHATQGTSANRPARKTAIQGGKDVLRFDGSNDSLSIPSSTATFKFLHSEDATVFIVAKPGTVANPNAIYALVSTNTNGSGGSVGYILSYEDRILPGDGFYANDQLRVLIGAADSVVSTIDQGPAGFTANTFKVATAITKPTQATAASRVSARINGGAAVSGNTATTARSTANATADFTIGQNSNGTFRLTGDIAEIIIYDSALSDANRAFVESYLMTKWGIS